MSKYLDKFVSSMPAAQGRQIMEILRNLKDIGTIKTVSEYNAKLQTLSAHLKSVEIQPIFKLLRGAIGEIIDSDRFNAMVKAIRMDLEAGFEEAENIATVLTMHKFLYKMTVLKTLRKAVSELEKTISLYEFFNRDDEGFIDAQFNTFDTADGMATHRTDALAENLYYDNNISEEIDEEEDAQVDLFGERLVMPTSTSRELNVAGIELIDDAETSSSNQNVQFTNSSIRSIIDQRRYTYWVYPILLESIASAGVKMKLRFDLGGMQEFNTMRIEPASPFPMTLEGISYIGEDGDSYSVSLDTIIESDKSFNLGGITARFVTLTFRQDNHEEAYYYKDNNSNMATRLWEDTDPEEPDLGRIDRITSELENEIPDADLREALDLPSGEDWEKVQVYQYTFGLDNVRFYLDEYRMRGVFVGEKFTVEKPGLIGLRATEVNPTIEIGGTDYNQFSFEYYVVKRDFASTGAFIEEQTLPILPLEYGGQVTNERLPLVSIEGALVSNTALMRFVPDVGSQTPTIKKNLTEDLAISTDYTVEVNDSDDWQSDWDDVLDEINGEAGSSTAPIPIKIKFTNPDPHSVYTIRYMPSTRMADTDARPRKLSDYDSLQDNTVIRTKIQKLSTEVASSDLYLVVVIRNNYIDPTETAAIEDYKLLVSSYDKTKYLE